MTVDESSQPLNPKPRGQELRTVTWRITVAYVGTSFHGWQRQLGGIRTVQGELERVLTPMAKDEVFVQGAGRTDAGVHAHGQVASVRISSRLTSEKFILALGVNLDPDLAVVRVDEAAPGFCAKRHSIGKHYRYSILARPAHNPFLRPFVWHQRFLKLEPMQKAARHLLGEQDFESFRSVHCDAAHARRFIWAVDVDHDAVRDGVINIDVKGNAFCRNMVRVIAGTLVEVGRGRFQPDDVLEILNAKDRRRAGMTAPPEGLSLQEVYYPDTCSHAGIPKDAVFPGWPVDASTWPPSDVVKARQSSKAVDAVDTFDAVDAVDDI